MSIVDDLRLIREANARFKRVFKLTKSDVKSDREELILTRKANMEFASKCKLAQSNLKEVIKMATEERQNKPERTQMSAAKETMTKQLEMLDMRLKALRAERNVVARALKGLGRFY